MTDRPPHRDLRFLLFSNIVWVSLRPAKLIIKSSKMGPMVYRPYPSRLEDLPFADVITKAAFSPQLF